LTLALIRGCAAARGKYVARQDVGDASLPGRLAKQKAVLDEHEDCVFVSCWTRFVGPKGEFLFLHRGTGAAKGPSHILCDTELWGITDGPTHHGSVMFRREAYSRVGGYRQHFYYGQDYDLWFRLAEIGKFGMLDDCLLEARLGPSSISASFRNHQRKFARASRAALALRRAGHPDTSAIEVAKRIPVTRSNKTGYVRAQALYFIGQCLFKNRDPRAIDYLQQAIRSCPFYLRPRVSLALYRLRELGAKREA
jgi:hypothetical protein